MNTKLIFIFVLFNFVLIVGCKKMTPEKAESKVQSLLEKTVTKKQDLRHGILLGHCQKEATSFWGVL